MATLGHRPRSRPETAASPSAATASAGDGEARRGVRGGGAEEHGQRARERQRRVGRPDGRERLAGEEHAGGGEDAGPGPGRPAGAAALA